jgi:hypothetical protein
MRRTPFFILYFVFNINCFGQTVETKIFPDSLQDNKIWTDTVDNTIMLGWQDIYDKLPILEFEDIPKSTFITYKKNYHTKLNTDSSKVVYADSTFTIQTAKAKIKYQTLIKTKEKRSGHYTYYKGFIDDLKLYVLEGYSVGAEFTLGDSWLIDSATNICYEFVGHSDYPFEPPIFSPNNQYMVTYIKNLFTPEECFLGIIKITKEENTFKYKEFASTKTGLIEDLVWINNNAFALKVKHEKYDEINRKYIYNYSYSTAVLPR